MRTTMAWWYCWELMRVSANGEIVTELATGPSYARNVGVEHNVVNPDPYEFVLSKSSSSNLNLLPVRIAIREFSFWQSIWTFTNSFVEVELKQHAKAISIASRQRRKTAHHHGPGCVQDSKVIR